jgi:hypothetical protein
MKTLKILVLGLGLVSLMSGTAQAAFDLREASAPGGGTQWDNYLYGNGVAYPSGGLDWGWTHGSIAGAYSNYSLSISAYDVDNGPTAFDDELDGIYAKKAGVYTLLGYLAGANGVWSFTNFNLDSTWTTDINNGLEVAIDIDSANNYQKWAVSITKSVLSTEGLPTNPNPGGSPGVPDGGSTIMLLGAAGTALAGLKRFKK